MHKLIGAFAMLLMLGQIAWADDQQEEANKKDGDRLI